MPPIGALFSPQRASTPTWKSTGMIALDTETTGRDFYHGTKPFFVTIFADGDDYPTCWEWDVDPYTREPHIPKEDIEEIRNIIEVQGNWGNGFDEEIAERHTLILHNPKFDAQALASIGITNFPWHQVRDTITAAHLIASNSRLNLTDCVLKYLKDEHDRGIDIEPAEKEVEKVVQECRRLCRSKFPDWKIAKHGYDDMPSVKKSAGKDKEDKAWKADMWLPRALAMELGLDESHLWWSVCATYANTDSMSTLPLWKELKRRLHFHNLWDIYKVKNKLPYIAYKMEKKGVTVSKDNLEFMATEFQEESTEKKKVCLNIAKSYNYDLLLPKGASVNNSLRDFIFNTLSLEKTYKEKAKSDGPTLDKNAMSYYLHTLDEDSKEWLFIRSILDIRARDKALGDLDGYKRFWIPLGKYNEKGEQLWYSLHPNLNPNGTTTLRWSCKNPNEQNIKKAGMTDDDEMSLRFCVAPAPGREFWSLDAKNLERRIPAYLADETDIIRLLERPHEAPYYGSEHLLVAHILYPKEFEECRGPDGEIDGRIFKKRYAATLYQWIKNGNFCIQYGGQRKKADATYRLDGAYDTIKSRFWKQEALNQKCIKFADSHGYVETLPDRTVDPKRGYPLLCAYTDYGKILPTVPLNYHVQGSAMWWMMMSMIRVEEWLEQWRREGFDAWLVMQIHDELVFDLPKRDHPLKNPPKSNLPRIHELRKLMEVNGQNLIPSIPTPVSIEYHEFNWSEGVTCA